MTAALRPDLNVIVLAIEELGATVISAADDDQGTRALAYAANGYRVFPARGKVPLIAGGNGVLDATDDLRQVARWWTDHPHANIAGRVPDGVVVVDVDPRSGGHDTWAQLVAEHGLVRTRTATSGRSDGGFHLHLRHPGGKVRKSIGRGVDVKTSTGYTMLPNSIHPDSGKPYRWVDPAAPISTAPEWLADLLRDRPEPARPSTATGGSYLGNSVADWFSATTTWEAVLRPHGWALVSGSGDHDGSRWRHPAATHPWSATVKHRCLFVYSSNTPFTPTEAEYPHGYTLFRAFALLEHGGDLSAAARAAMVKRGAA